MLPTCTVRLYVGSGIPGRAGRYRDRPLSFDKRDFTERVERLVGQVFPNATYFKTRGVWKGGSEAGLMVEVLASPVRASCGKLLSRARTVARRIARALGQQAVLLVVRDARGSEAHDLVSAA